MKKSTLAAVLIAALAGAFSAHAQSTAAPNKPVAPSKPAAPTLSVEQRATQKAASQAKFAAMSRQEKAANKGNMQRPTKPAAPTAPTGRR